MQGPRRMARPLPYRPSLTTGMGPVTSPEHVQRLTAAARDGQNNHPGLHDCRGTQRRCALRRTLGGSELQVNARALA